LGDDRNNFSIRNYCTASNVWLCTLSRHRNHCPHYLLCHLLKIALRNLCKTSSSNSWWSFFNQIESAVTLLQPFLQFWMSKAYHWASYLPVSPIHA
jgi:hypothetical protein